MSNQPGLPLSASSESRVLHFPIEERASLSESLLRHIPALDLERAEFLIAFGAIYVDSYRVMTDIMVKPTQQIRAHILPRRYPAAAIDWKRTIVEETPDFVIVNKPQGLPVHPTLDNAREDVLSALSAHLKRELFITQRLDVGTGGLFCIAKTKEFQKHFNRWLAERKIDKFYLAAARVSVPLGPLTHYMLPGERAPRLVQREVNPAFAECRMDVQSVQSYTLDSTTSVYAHRIHLLTGRTHQIRTQFGFEGAPLIGDQLYAQVYQQYRAGQPGQPLQKPDPRTIVDERFGLWCTDLNFNEYRWHLEISETERLRLFRDINSIVAENGPKAEAP
jgi:23S rRNA-/tRNA-specific pseudouridylate synthase